ncbi:MULTISPECIES: beta-glucoside-specific PTS transporter subunit IIABC [Bacillus amyloliquefaciens group]|uniref:beta-glucoside-specific PTS transporter subunit IIABC n=1 Tax=Bacillus amyloliquefaciens group TaxID=1938374 RepID=UPI0014593166|nr:MULTISPECIES: beta-glucoside-specific PTS transporter subunit IIABC [Bacillus amyloliquefaciens group]MCR4364914.1 beta-glucoside-specific PTS transporter subunit IIABC [Bacillus amyloliquefaciens]MCV3198637.1 beta-glucoside-specific PTS transporter subunit IIABC [Bacillus velezensis]MDP1502277.1 beta-glucoside-specific PTS transporter subunit IIABC [Bacillus velezensis]MDP1506136.1 beta-glucoside-specific PTS transporter subunit IIABC [Bacillus velezensis]MDW0353866.1 PTS beta-glucoside tr
MDYHKISKEILQLVGGEENVQSVIHCMTRLRFNLYDNAKADRSGLEQTEGVMGTNISGGQFQIIIGNHVPKVYQALMESSGLSDESANKTSKQKKNVLSAVFDVISGVFTPILPAIAGAGMIKGLVALAVTFGWMSEKSQTHSILTAVGDGAFYFLPLLLAVSAARKFRCNPYVAAAVAGAILHPDLTALLGAGKSISFIGLPVTAATYSSTVIPILLAIWLMSYVEKGIDRITPSSLKLIAVPMLTLVIVVPVTLITVGPLGAILGNYLSVGVNDLFNHAGIAAMILLAGTFSLIIMTGMHYALVPIMINNIAQNGHDYILPAMFLANMGQAGASFAVFLKSKNKTFKSLAFTTGITALMGITEPAMYGVNMRLKKPFAAALIGGAAGGAFYGVTGVASYIVGGNAGLPSIPVFIGPTFLYALIGLFISFAAGIAAALLIGFEDVQSERDKASEAPGVTAGGEIIHSPIKGEVKALSEVNDSVFSGGMMGKGFAILPEEGAAVSPVEGRVTAVFKTKHAIGITSARGAEVLIHIGLDTVRLDGRHFEMHVKEGDTVAPGDLLITFDIDEIKAAGFDVITPVIITNTDQYSFTDVKKSGMVKPNEALLALS